jgi:hypothetical protein
MNSFPVVYDVNTKEELIIQVRSVNSSLIDFYMNVPEDLLFAEAIPSGWTVARNMKHVSSTNNSFSFWIGLPNFFLKYYSKPSLKQLSAAEIVPTNRPNISNYGTYYKLKSKNSNLEEKKNLLDKIQFSNEKVINALNKRSQDELLKFASPMGGYNLQNLTLFLLKHNIHHSNVARLRLEQGKF